MDGLDYNKWSLHYLAGGDFTDGNFNEDAAIDGLDYNVWSLNYQNGCEGSAVPEPGLAVLLMAAVGPIVLRRRWRSH